MVIHHEQNHQVHLSFRESSAVDDGARERPFHRHSVLDLTRELFRVKKINLKKTNKRAYRLTEEVDGNSPLCAAWPPVVWLQRPWISAACVAPPCCESPAALGSAAGTLKLALACRSLKKKQDENAERDKSGPLRSKRHREQTLALSVTTKAPINPPESKEMRSYRVAPRCQCGCRRCDCRAEVAVGCFRSAVPGCRRADSYTGGGRRRILPNLGWPPQPVRQAETPDSPPLRTSTRQPWGEGGVILPAADRSVKSGNGEMEKEGDKPFGFDFGTLSVSLHWVIM